MGKLRSLAFLLALGSVLTACASDDPAAVGSSPQAPPVATPTPAAFPVTVHGTNGDVAIAARPERIVSLSPTATEDLFAIGAGEQVIAVDELSNYPETAPVTTLSGYEPNVEAIAGYEPDLVVFATETGDMAASLRELGITALQLDAAASLDEAYEQIDQLGAATGHAEEASTLVAQMRSDVDDIVASADAAAGLSFYYELDDTYYSVTSDTFIGQLLALVGLKNIADAVGKGSGGYPQLSAEYIVQADPDLIFLADTICCGQSPRTVARRPGWAGIAAVRGDDVIPLDDDVASRWGPRVVTLLQQIADAAAEAGERAA
jgi:iron complex transport system substrate-binding protein